MEFPNSIPGEGYSHMLIDCDYDPCIPLSLHLVKYEYSCTPEHKEPYWFYNDPYGLNRWTLTPYATHHLRSGKEDFYAFHRLPVDYLRVTDFEVQGLLEWMVSEKDIIHTYEDPFELWKRILK